MENYFQMLCLKENSGKPYSGCSIKCLQNDEKKNQNKF